MKRTLMVLAAVWGCCAARGDIPSAEAAPIRIDAAVASRAIFTEDSLSVAYSPAWQEVVATNDATVVVTLTGGDRGTQTLKEGRKGETGSFTFDLTTLAAGSSYEFKHAIKDAQGNTVDELGKRFTVLDLSQVYLHGGTLTSNETWKADRVHVVTADVNVPSAYTITFGAGTIVKFASGTGIFVANGGTVYANGVVFTHINDDTIGGDTLYDGDATKPEMDAYKLDGNWSLSDDCEMRFAVQPPLSGTISSSRTLRRNSLYEITGNLIVASGATLTIPEGVILKFASGVQFTINSGATLNANGTRAAPIVFTSIKDDAHGGDTNGDGDKTAPAGGDWKYVYVQGVANLNYVEAMYAAPNNETGILETSGSGRLTMNSCTVAHAKYDGVWNWGGEITATNCVIVDVGNGACPYRGAKNEYVNCVFYGVNHYAMYWSHWTGVTSFKNCIMSAIGTNWIDANGATLAPANMTVSNCLFFNEEGVGPQSFNERVGNNGNIWGDPKFIDPDNGDFRTQAGSACVDAGDGTVAPEMDYYGQPRMDVASVKDTGVPNGDGVCPDIGIYEMTGIMAGAAPDMQVLDVTASETVKMGEEITLTWNLKNVGEVSFEGSRRDSFELISEDGGRTVELGTVVQHNALNMGDVCRCTASFKVPVEGEGVWYVKAHVNSYRDVFEGTNVQNNVCTSTTKTTITIDENDGSDELSGTVSAGSSFVAKMALDSAKSYVGRIQAPAGVRVYYGIGFMPDEKNFSGKAVCTQDGAIIGIPPTDAKVYILIVSDQKNSGDVKITFEEAEMKVSRVEPGTVPSSGKTSIMIHGANFADGVQVFLVEGGNSVALTNLSILSNERIQAEVDCASLKAGTTYGIRLVAGDDEDTLQDCLTVEKAKGSANLVSSLDVPDSIREGRTIVVAIDYENTGNLDMAAPIFTVRAKGLTFVVDGVEYEDSVKVIGLSAEEAYDILRPHEEQRLTLTAKVRPGTGTSVSYRLSTTHEGLKGAEKPLRLDQFFNPDWIFSHDPADDALIERLREKMGATWSEFYTRLAQYAATLRTYNQEMKGYETIAQKMANEILRQATQEIENEKATMAQVAVRTEASSSANLAQAKGAQLMAAGVSTFNQELQSLNGKTVLENEPDKNPTGDPNIERKNYDFDGDWAVPMDQPQLRRRTERHHDALRQDNSDSGDIWVYHWDGVNGRWYKLANNLNTGLIKVGSPSVLICHGNLHSIHSQWVKDMAHAWKTRENEDEKDSNIMAVDWGDDATATDESIKKRDCLAGYLLGDDDEGNPNIWLPEFAFATAKDIPGVAQRAYENLTKAGILPNKLTIIGHSHGGHVAGNIAGRFAKTSGRVKRLIGLETSNYDSHALVARDSCFPKSWNGDSALQTEFYKTSYNMSMGSTPVPWQSSVAQNDDPQNIFGHYNFHLVKVGEDWFVNRDMLDPWNDPTSSDNDSPEGRLLATRHDSVQEWFMKTIKEKEHGLGYEWVGETSWKHYSNQDAPKRKYHGVVNMRDNKLEFALPEGVGLSDWRYHEVIVNYSWFEGRNINPHDMLQRNLASAIEYDLTKVDYPTKTFKTGEKRELKLHIRNNADNLSIPYEEFNREKEGDRGVKCPWQNNLAESVWLFDLRDLSDFNPTLENVRKNKDRLHLLHEWSIKTKDAFVMPTDGVVKDREIVIGHKVLKGDLDENGEEMLLISVVGAKANGILGKNLDFYEGDLCFTNNYTIEKIRLKKGDGPIAKIKVDNQGPYENGEMTHVIYAEQDSGKVTVSLDASASEKDKMDIVRYEWWHEDAAAFQTVSIGSKQKITKEYVLAPDEDTREVVVTLRITDKDDLQDRTSCTLKIVRKVEEPEDDQDNDNSTVPKSCDPNEMSGPLGTGDPETERFVKPGEWMDYTIYYENKTNATAAAQEVFVNAQLSEYLDWSTFEMKAVSFGEQIDMGLEGRSSGASEVTMDGTNFLVRTELVFDETTGQASWYMRIKDPTTIDSWPADQFAGFLPPNNPETHCGEGYISYRVKVRADAPKNAVIDASADIVFDHNEVIVTDPAWWNTVGEVLKPLAYTAVNGQGTYNGNARGIGVSVSKPTGGYTIQYATSENGPWSNTKPTYKNVCSGVKTYFKITAEGYEEVIDYRTVTITPKTLTESMVTLTGTSDLVYDGTEKKPVVTVTDGNPSIITSNDYTVSYGDNVEPGTATVTVTGKGNYTGRVVKTFFIDDPLPSDTLPTLRRAAYEFDLYKGFGLDEVYDVYNLAGGTKNRVSLKKVGKGRLPSGVRLKYDKKTGKVLLTGTPSKVGAYVYVFRIDEKRGRETVKGVEITFTFNVADIGKLDSTDPDYNSTVGQTVKTEVPIYDGDTNVVGMLAVNVSKSNKITAKLTGASRKAISFKGAWQRVEDGEVSSVMTTRKGETLELVLKRGGNLVAYLSGLTSDYGSELASSEIGVRALPPANIADYVGTHLIELDGGTIKLKIDKKGKVSCSGRTANKVSISVRTYLLANAYADGSMQICLLKRSTRVSYTYVLKVGINGEISLE